MTTIEYQNGNCRVTLHADGTKVREWDGDAQPEFPESVDLKITEQCDIGCKFCHESATPNGKHASHFFCRDLIPGLPKGVEIAVGGGNVFAHPQLVEIISLFTERGLIINVTLRIEHALDDIELLTRLRRLGIVHGVGLSGGNCIDAIEQMCPTLIDENTVLHFVAGVDNPWDVLRLSGEKAYKILVLGYKPRGRGLDYYDEKVANNVDAWRYWLPSLLRKTNLLVSFDNLALRQLNVQSLVPADEWSAHYMGDDGQFTLFVDAVQGEYAKSSSEQIRRPLDGKTIREAFWDLRIDRDVAQ